MAYVVRGNAASPEHLKKVVWVFIVKQVVFKENDNLRAEHIDKLEKHIHIQAI